MTKPLLNIIIAGPQGSGKGTQAKILAERFHLAHIETGKIFRRLARQKSALGRQVNRIMNEKGRLVPFNLVVRILKRELTGVLKNKGLIFDGYPRTLVQARALEKILAALGRRITYVFYLPIPRKMTIKRLVTRRTCERCGRIFILGATLKCGSTRCPVCGGQVYQRIDDQPAAITERLRIFNQQTKPLVAYYARKGVLITVDGKPPIPAVTKNILQHLA